jgi:signal transduction protein with GAF and PtsI domain
MSEANNNPLEQKLRALVETTDIAGVLTEPLTRSIENLLRISAGEMNSGEASVLVRDGDQGDLKFLTAIGEVADQLMDMKIPAGKGIAGFVISSGQPMAVADAGGEETFYAEVDKKTGYSTQIILATPLRQNGEIIGVLEYINRRGEPPYASFTPEEMDKAAFFAEAIASLISAYESAKLYQGMCDKLASEEGPYDLQAIKAWIGNLRETSEHTEMLELAVLLREIAGRGDAERAMCRDILETVLRFSDSKTETGYLGY